MFKKIIILASAISPFLFASPAYALQTCKSAIQGARLDRICDFTPEAIIPAALTLIIVLGILIALFFLVYGGIKWVTSGGDKGAVESARNTVIFAIIGLIVAFFVFVIVNLILSLFFNNNLTHGFKIPVLNWH